MKKTPLFFIVLIMILLSCKTVQQEQAPRVPAWAKEAVWYQIFPERFANGDKSNDPKPIDLKGGWPYFVPEDWQVQPWTSDWYKVQPWEKNTGFGFYENAGLRRYGGDLQGVLDKLDYLQDLGVNAIYFNPLFESPSLHKYDAAMYHHIDNNFGPDPEGDRLIWEKENPADPKTWQMTSADKLFLKLIDEAHKRGMKIIIDGVFNHVGNMFWAFQDVIKNQEKSEFKDWFYIKNFDNSETDSNEFDYEGWFGVRDLPEIKEDEHGLVAAPAMHVKDVVKRWMDPNGDGDPSDGIDGWRLDVAEMVKLEFWKTFRGWVKEINPDAYITGEIWWHDWNHNKMFNAAPWLAGDAFDAVMNYRFTRAVKKFVVDQETQVGPRAFVDTLNTIYRDYHPDNAYAIMNLLGSHDAERLQSLIVNPDHWYDHGAVPKDRQEFDVRKANDTELLRQKLCVGLQMTLPGAPMIYYGDEAGMWGGDDPDCRKPMVWPGLEYETETTHPFGKERQVNTVEFNTDLFNWYKKMTSLRKSDRLFSLGDVKFITTDDENKILVYTRSLDNETACVVVNNNPTEKEVVIDAAEAGIKNAEADELVSNSKIKITEGKIALKLEPYQIMVLK